MKFLIAASILTLSLSNAYSKRQKFASAHSVALIGTIEAGIMYTKSTFGLESQIREQLMYSIGHLNGLEGGSPDMKQTKISVQDTSTDDQGLTKVNYKAELYVAWPEERNIPKTFSLTLPARGDYQGLSEFFKAYGADEKSTKKCLDWSAHDVSQGVFWYYYRPQKRSCPLSGGNFDNELVISTDMKLAKAKNNTKGKNPEYEKVWEDGKLVITTIFGKAEEGSTSSWDAGVSAYTQTISAILSKFGTPKFSSVELINGSFQDPLKNTEINLIFDTEKGEVDVALYLIEGIRTARPSFRSSYNKRTLDSDFISYSGHSGLGANIRALARMGEFKKDQYQIFLVNGCDTFAYVDDALRDAHKRVNPAFGADKFIDVITNAMPSYFHMNKRSNMAMIDALFLGRGTYENILSQFDRKQRAVVTGEEDNNYPKPFYE